MNQWCDSGHAHIIHALWTAQSAKTCATQLVPNSAEHELTDNGPSWQLVSARSSAREYTSAVTARNASSTSRDNPSKWLCSLTSDCTDRTIDWFENSLNSRIWWSFWVSFSSHYNNGITIRPAVWSFCSIHSREWQTDTDRQRSLHDNITHRRS